MNLEHKGCSMAAKLHSRRKHVLESWGDGLVSKMFAAWELGTEVISSKPIKKNQHEQERVEGRGVRQEKGKEEEGGEKWEEAKGNRWQEK